MDGRVGVPVVLLALADVLQVADALLAFLRKLVHGAVHVLAPGQRAAERATTDPVAHGFPEAGAFVNQHECCYARAAHVKGTATSSR